MNTEDVNKAIDLNSMRDAIVIATQYAKRCGFGYEVIDAFNELRGFAEFELDELGVEY